MTPSGAGADPAERLRRRVALAATLLLNAAFLAALVRLMHPGTPEPVAGSRPEPRDVMQARLIDAAPPPAPPVAAGMAEPPVVARVRSASRSAAGPVERPARADAVPSPSREATAPSVAAAPRFFEADGRVRLPEAVAEAAETPFPQGAPVPAGRNPLVHHDALPYEPTRFDPYFPSVRETLAGELVRKASRQRTVRTSSGLQITCSWVLIFGGCNWGHAPVAPIEELKAMRVDLPPLKPVAPDAGPGGTSAGAVDPPP